LWLTLLAEGKEERERGRERREGRKEGREGGGGMTFV
jgi:hypothetical protein